MSAGTLLTADDLLAMPDGDDYELVFGQLVERKMGMEASHVAGEIFGRIREFNRSACVGLVLPEGTGYRCFPDDLEKVRRPDTSVVLFGRLAGNVLPKGFCPVAPDLVVEVVSPNDLLYEVDAKVDEWLAAGASLVWVVNPEARSVRVYGSDGRERLLRASDEISGDDVLPGFHCRVADLFSVPQPPA